MMSPPKILRGSCHCGRNQYVVQIPAGASPDAAQVIFDSNAPHRISSASPLSAFIRVPLSWYHSQTFAFLDDESRSSIRRFYSHPAEQHAMRHFCGFCGTPLSYWSEEPRSEADYIQLTLGSLLTEDLHDLEEFGLIPNESEDDAMHIVPVSAPRHTAILSGRDITSIPWFESMLSGSRLGNMHTTRTIRASRDGRVRVEFEITEWTANEDADDDGATSESSNTGKRKRGQGDVGETSV
ncbi:hypothetical protein F4778DRAFT_649931 [Xylariomycetidae sp. FL2044]|nr:hypothetical protein F4778DRAFT_649931 [Xylariomycetidae sp. FL2044]